MATKAEIKNRFKTNNIPTEKDFADLIDSAINRDDDGIERTSGGGIHITGSGDTREVLSFSRPENPRQSPWKINLNLDSGNPGFNITDDKTDSRLMINELTGNIGINTGKDTPHTQLTVVGAIHFNSEDFSPNKQGGYLSWNRSGGGGETNLVNNRGEGQGGFDFLNCDADGSNITRIGRVEGNGEWKLPDLSVINSFTVNKIKPEARLDVDGGIDVRAGIRLKHNGCIRLTGDTDVDLQTNELGLYSTQSEQNIRFVTNKAPFHFFTDYQDADGERAGTTARLTINPESTDKAIPRVSVNGAVHFGGQDFVVWQDPEDSGNRKYSFKDQGGYLTWNLDHCTGLTGFVNHRGNGPGGFEFYNYAADQTMERIGYVDGVGNWELPGLKVLNRLTVKDISITGTFNGGSIPSDIRIKKDINHSDQLISFNQLNQLKVADYRFIDGRNNRSQLVKGFIAQELEKVIPEAVIAGQGFVPDIYERPQSVTEDNGQTVFTMENPHGLQQNDVVQLIIPTGSMEKTVTIVNGNTFSVPGDAAAYINVMVYGKQVNDFKSVDYNYLFMLNISATQQLTAELAELKTEHERLKIRTRALETSLNLTKLPN